MATTTAKTQLECYFDEFRKDIIGINQTFQSPFGEKRIIYTDWTASGRLYRPIEEKLMNEFGPFVANTHTETSVTGTAMTIAYHEARHIIKKHVNASENDILITDGTGMTGPQAPPPFRPEHTPAKGPETPPCPDSRNAHRAKAR